MGSEMCIRDSLRTVLAFTENRASCRTSRFGEKNRDFRSGVLNWHGPWGEGLVLGLQGLVTEGVVSSGGARVLCGTPLVCKNEDLPGPSWSFLSLQTSSWLEKKGRFCGLIVTELVWESVWACLSGGSSSGTGGAGCWEPWEGQLEAIGLALTLLPAQRAFSLCPGSPPVHRAIELAPGF